MKNILIINKKGSHISIILSMVLFVTFLVFLFTLLGSNLEVQKNKNLAIESLNVELENLFSSNFTTMSILISDSFVYDALTYPNSCISIPHLAGFEEFNSTIKDEDNTIIDSFSENASINISWSTETDFLKIYYSNESLIAHELANLDCQPLGEGDFLIKSINHGQKIYENKINYYISIYDEYYKEFKSSLQIPFETEFSFNFTNNNQEEVGPVINLLNQEVYVKDFTIEYIDEEANINPGTLSIIVW